MNVSSLLQGFGLARPDSTEPPPSVFAEWNKYASGDVESRGAAPLASQGNDGSGSFLGSFGASAGTSSTTASQSSAPSLPMRTINKKVLCSFRIPSGTDFVYFAGLLCGAAVFFFLAFFLFLPMLVIAPGKFALSFTCGSICTMAAMLMLSGWKAGLSHMVSPERLPFTTVYVGSMLATLYAAVSMKSYLLSLTFSFIQVFALLYYILSYFPGGAQGMQFLMGMIGKTIASCIGGRR